MFDTREVQPPTGNRSTYVQPITADNVLDNLKFAIAEKNLDNYLKCFVDSNFSTRRFKFFPDALSQSQYPVFLNWSLNNERVYYSNLISFTSENASRNLFINSSVNIGIDSAIIDADYLLVYDHNKLNIPKVFKGKLRFIMGIDNRSLWSIHNWYDFVNDNNDTTWSVLKANFVN